MMEGVPVVVVLVVHNRVAVGGRVLAFASWKEGRPTWASARHTP